MPLQPGSRLGAYEVLGPLGAGGMGEVYRARDSRLGRDVALKVLPDLFVSDAERLARFQREAQVLASLNHANIAAIYGLEEAGGVRALVLELVEGPTLSERLTGSTGSKDALGRSEDRPLQDIGRGGPSGRPIPIDEALLIARQIADALAAAHDLGIVHRDLKPANIKVRSDGTVKVLDFGLAKMRDAAGTAANLSHSPTMMLTASMPGTILGTAAYMAPEQAKGKETDRTADVWAFGCVLYEMLTGRAVFEGETAGEILGGVFRAEPEWQLLPADTPDAVRRLLRRCLQKDRKLRLHDMADARLELDEAPSSAPVAAPVAPSPSRTRERLAWISALALVMLAAAAAIVVVEQRASSVPPPPETRLEINTASTSDLTSFAISPDGRRLVFAASAISGGQSQLWLRPLDATTAQPLAGTEGATYPFWSPDSRSVAFFANSQLKRVDLGAGLPQTLATAPGPRGGTWNSEGVILFMPSTGGGLFRIPASGGEPVAATNLAAGQTSHRFPQFLPGGRQFVFYVRGAEALAGIYLGSLDTPVTKRLTAAEAAGTYAPPGWLMFVRQGTLVARRFDAARGELTGDSINVADPVAVDPTASAAAYSVSAAGLVTYRAGGTTATQLTWFDRTGKALGTVGAPDENGRLGPTLSPDGRRVAVYRTVQGNTDVWLLDAVRTVRFTVDTSFDGYPLWSRDGNRIVFSNSKKGAYDLYQKTSTGAGAEELLLESPVNKTAMAWSPDSRFLLYLNRDPKTAGDLLVLPMQGDKKPFPFLNSSFEERLGQFSPDGRWVAYQSDESGRPEIYLRPFPGPGGQWQVSTSGGIAPRWRHDGRELYYIAPDAKLMAAPIAIKGAAPEPGIPATLFQTRIIYGGSAVVGINWQYDVAADGRFLINGNTAEAITSPITVIQNWQPKQ